MWFEFRCSLCRELFENVVLVICEKLDLGFWGRGGEFSFLLVVVR